MRILEVNNPKNAGVILRELRLDKGETQAHAAKALNTLPKTLSRIERNQKKCTMDFFCKAVIYYGIDEARIFLTKTKDGA